MRFRPTVLTVVALLTAALALPAPTAVADGHVQTLIAIDPAAGEFPGSAHGHGHVEKEQP